MIMIAHLAMIPLLLAAAPPASRPASADSSCQSYPFFALDVGTRDEKHQTPRSQLRMMKELGFAGWACALMDMQEPLKIADALGVKIFAVYTGVDLDGKDPAWDPRLPDVLQALKDRDAAIWLFVTSSKARAQSDEADDRAVELIKRVAALAAESQVRVSMYPHNGFYVASTRDALRLIRKAKSPNLGVTFNLCHWLKVDGGKDLEDILQAAMPYLDMVTINGADKHGEGWKEFIQPLGEGDFDVYGLLARLKTLGFKGPVGLQGYGLKGETQEHLAHGMKTWREYCRRLAEVRAASGASQPAASDGANSQKR